VTDPGALRRTLADVEHAARALPWAKERAWTAATHCWEQGGVTVLDLHDLDAAVCRALVRAVRAAPPPNGAVVWVHGVGRRSGPRGPVLGHVLRGELAPHGTLRTLSPGRTAWIYDAAAAPGWVKGELGCATRALFLLLAALALVALWAAFVR
jgi:hypothetical protein